eukprot:6410492-Pyramimonas_sp.AAC.1
MPGHASFLELLATEALWPGARRFPDDEEKRKCKRRGQPETIFHQQWGCSQLQASEGTAFDLAGRAAAEHEDCPCFWSRGL